MGDGFPLRPLDYYGRKVQQLGSGTSGSVYLTDKDYAIKEMMLEDGLSEVRAIGFMLPQYCGHPNYQSRYIDICTGNGKIYIVMPRAICDVYTYLYSREKVPEEVKLSALTICYHMALALSQLHNRQIAHFDIKPENYLIHHDDIVRLTDYNITEDCVCNGKIYAHSKYSPSYVAPEFHLFNVADIRSDIWALGITFIEIFCDDISIFPILNIEDPQCDMMLKILETFGALDNTEWPEATESSRWQDYYNTISNGNKLSVLTAHGGHVYSLLCDMLQYNPDRRLTINEIVQHPAFLPVRKTVVCSLPSVKYYPRIEYNPKETYWSNRQNALVWMLNKRAMCKFDWPVYGMAVTLFDSYTSQNRSITFPQMVLVAAASLSIATMSIFTKGLVYPIDMDQLLAGSSSILSKQQILSMQDVLLKTLKFELHSSSVFMLIGSCSQRRIKIAAMLSLTSVFLTQDHGDIYLGILELLQQGDSSILRNITREIYHVLRRTDSNQLNILTDEISIYFSKMMAVPP